MGRGPVAVHAGEQDAAVVEPPRDCEAVAHLDDDAGGRLEVDEEEPVEAETQENALKKAMANP